MGCGWGRELVECVQNAPIRVREEVSLEVEHDVGSTSLPRCAKRTSSGSSRRSKTSTPAAATERRSISAISRSRWSSSRRRAGDLKLVPEPAGTRGYDDLRRRADGEPLGRGLRPQIASTDDLARMLGTLDRDQDVERLLRLRRLMNLEHSPSHELGRSRGTEI
jgi:hypothetical protein